MGEDLERLKQRIPLLEYLQRHHWSGRPAGAREEFVGLCPLHEETRPSFFVNRRRNLFYCHGCRHPFAEGLEHRLERELFAAKDG